METNCKLPEAQDMPAELACKKAETPCKVAKTSCKMTEDPCNITEATGKDYKSKVSLHRYIREGE